MSSQLVETITAADSSVRHRPLEGICQPASLSQLLQETRALHLFSEQSDNLYERVRALMFLYAIHRFYLPEKLPPTSRGLVPFKAYSHFLNRRFAEAIEVCRAKEEHEGPSDSLSSTLAASYHRLAFQTLSDQVRRSVRSVRGNQWMFRMGHPADQPLRIRPELLHRSAENCYPLLWESTPVRMDLTHSAWSDIFFLGMDFPEGAKVLNISIDLAVQGRHKAPAPPIAAYFRVIPEPLLRLTSVDLRATADITQLGEVFDFAKDYLGLLKAGVIASGIVPPGIEGSGKDLAELLARIAGPQMGIELVTHVNDIPKGSRLAVSTNLLASIIAVCMRATAQTENLLGELQENERRLVLARAILGEWLGGSGGGWQDSGGVWPGIKLIEGVLAGEGDPEQGISRGCLLPAHTILPLTEISSDTRQRLQDSLVVVHGGMAQNVGPILEMVTEKYLLRSSAEWEARLQTLHILHEILAALSQGDIRALGQATTRNFFGPLQTIIPWATNHYTERLITQVREKFRDQFWGFWMLGGMAGGGMGFIFAPEEKNAGESFLAQIMAGAKKDLENALPFAMEPVVYDFSINQRGTDCRLLAGADALFPPDYYALMLPRLLRTDPRILSEARRAELDNFGSACRNKPELQGTVQMLFDLLLPRSKSSDETGESLQTLLRQNGFDRTQHEQIREDLRTGRIGLAQNRLPAATNIQDVTREDVYDATGELSASTRGRGERALQEGEVAVVTLAAGLGSRWSQGAGVVKALHPFCKLGGQHRSFIETHLAKTRKTALSCGVRVPHIITTSFMTHAPIERFLRRQKFYGYSGELTLSRGRAVGLRLIPMVRDLRFAWEEMSQELLDEQAQKVRESLRAALIDWALKSGEANDYVDNMPTQCVHPIGHWYEVPNLMRNGVLLALLEQKPGLKYLMMHNVDTLGAHVDPGLLGLHIESEACLTFEVISRRMEDRGGGLARVNGQARLVEGLAMPREEEEFSLSYYNTMTTWIDIRRLLEAFQLSISELGDEGRVASAIRNVAAKMPTYVTLKEVKKRWGHGQEDILPVAQFEKLWSDMTALPGLSCRFAAVSRKRGQQLKEQAQLDGWVRDGSASYTESLCHWEPAPGEPGG